MHQRSLIRTNNHPVFNQLSNQLSNEPTNYNDTNNYSGRPHHPSRRMRKDSP
ncbi:MAG: hypothetical protein HYZ34_06470 [Ignavibacteriae bacterium]|nr:hypothetical protein [Ignavibacteriota bacterium]